MDLIGLPVTKLKQTHEYLEGSALDGFVNSPGLLSLAEQLMEGSSTLYLPFTAVKSPGGGRFHFHQDNQYTRFDGPGIWLDDLGERCDAVLRCGDADQYRAR